MLWSRSRMPSASTACQKFRKPRSRKSRRRCQRFCFLSVSRTQSHSCVLSSTFTGCPTGIHLDDDAAIALLLRPTRLWSAADILRDFAQVPKSAGVYAWYFDETPPRVPTADCHRSANGEVLLYVGIEPKRAADAKTTSRRTLRDRLRDHLAGNAEGSTLRFTLGCLLAQKLEIRLRRVGSGKRHTFTNPGEIMLDGWLAAHAHIAFAAVEHPWQLETRLLSMISLPLNLSGNAAHSFAAYLSQTRAVAKREAALLPVVVDSGGLRRALR
jgi:hypothetical protein